MKPTNLITVAYCRALDDKMKEMSENLFVVYQPPYRDLRHQTYPACAAVYAGEYDGAEPVRLDFRRPEMDEVPNYIFGAARRILADFNFPVSQQVVPLMTTDETYRTIKVRSLSTAQAAAIDQRLRLEKLELKLID